MKKIGKALRLLGKYLVMYLTMLMPRNYRLCVYGAWLGERFADNSKQLFLEAQRFHELRSIWITKDPEIVKEIRDMGYEAYLWNTKEAIWYQLRAKYAVVSNGISDLQHTYLGRAIIIDLWHGVPLKKIVYDNKYEKDWDGPKQRIRDFFINRPLGREYYVATSENFIPIYESAFRRPKKQILCLGQPRNDIFFQEEKPEPYFPGKNILLYCPTHRKEGADKIDVEKLFALEQLETYLASVNYYLVIKKHFYHRQERTDLKKYPHIIDVTRKGMDIQRLVMEAKALISDYSSIYIDYLLLDAPLVFYCYDYEQYLEEDREMYFDYEQVTPGVKAKNFKELFTEIQKIVAEGENYEREERERVKDFFFCKTGQGPVSEILIQKMIHREIRKSGFKK